MKITSGTYLFPVLGLRRRLHNLWLFQVIRKIFARIELLSRFSAGNRIMYSSRRSSRCRHQKHNFRINLLILATSAIAITAFNYRSGGDFIWRYNFPQFLCAIVIFYTATGSTLHKSEKSNTSSFCVLCRLRCTCRHDVLLRRCRTKSAIPSGNCESNEATIAKLSRLALSGLLLSQSRSRMPNIKQLDKSIPDHNFALENVARPYLFNYRTTSRLHHGLARRCKSRPRLAFRREHPSSYPHTYVNHPFAMLIYDYRLRWLVRHAGRAPP